jgi:hypothetical protein
MEEYTENHAVILKLLLELADKASHIDLSIGYVDSNRQCRKGIVIRSAPSTVVKAIVGNDRTRYCHLEADGLHIEPY